MDRQMESGKLLLTPQIKAYQLIPLYHSVPFKSHGSMYCLASLRTYKATRFVLRLILTFYLDIDAHNWIPLNYCFAYNRSISYRKASSYIICNC